MTGSRERPVQLRLAGISKRYADVIAADACSIDVGRGEVVALLGPSGCGKSTLLNVIAGFVAPDAGRVELAGREITALAPNQRGTGMVFQRYALFPHLSVRGNIAYGLQAQKLATSVVQERVAEMIALMKLGGMEDRYPHQLSGGQSQRVAVARALAIRPAVLLLDEAFSALDRNLRESMQLELSLLLRTLDITAILVTHDQREAFTLADRVAIMQAGRIVQIGTADAVYRSPANAFVMGFLGTANTLSAVAGRDGEIVAAERLRLRSPRALTNGQRVQLCVRSEDIGLAAAPTAIHAREPARIELVTFLGAMRRIVVQLGTAKIVCDSPADPASASGFEAGDAVFIDFAPERALVADEH